MARTKNLICLTCLYEYENPVIINIPKQNQQQTKTQATVKYAYKLIQKIHGE